jgi:cell division protein ZapD
MSNIEKRIVYEHPLNERTRSLLRLEHLFEQTEYHLPRGEIWNSRAAIDGLLGITSIFLRSDLKGDLIKEVDRYRNALERLSQNQTVDANRLDDVLVKLADIYRKLQASSGSPGQKMRRNEFLMDIMQRSSIPGGNCAFDLPYFHYWLQKPASEREGQLREWMGVYGDFKQAVEIILTLIRDSTALTSVVAKDGLYQQTLDPQIPTQLIRVSVAGDVGYFPEISGGRHRFTVRFMSAKENSRPAQCKQTVNFSLACCVL